MVRLLAGHHRHGLALEVDVRRSHHTIRVRLMALEATEPIVQLTAAAAGGIVAVCSAS